uniref:Uncharacterized protein n=1 Tax=Ixodes ricinus TaxID=34613 RepID=A0A6B0UTT8_IXORI
MSGKLTMSNYLLRSWHRCQSFQFIGVLQSQFEAEQLRFLEDAFVATTRSTAFFFSSGVIEHVYFLLAVKLASKCLTNRKYLHHIASLEAAASSFFRAPFGVSVQVRKAIPSTIKQRCTTFFFFAKSVLEAVIEQVSMWRRCF